MSPYFSLVDTAKNSSNSVVKNNKHSLVEDTDDGNKVIYRYDFDLEWKTESIPDMSVGRCGFAAVSVDDNKIFAFGGYSYGYKNRHKYGYKNRYKYLDTVESYCFDKPESSWKKLCPMPMPLYGCAAVNLDNENIHVFGGYNYDRGGQQSSLFKYSVSNNTWEECIPSMNIKRDGLAGIVVAGKIYAIGGKSGSFIEDSLDTVEVYDSSTSSTSSNKWVLLPSKMNTKRYGCCAVAINNIIYVFGGMDENYNTLNTIEMYDISSESYGWVQLSSTMNEKRCLASATALGNYIFIIGGRSEWCVESAVNTIEIFDTKTKQFVVSSGSHGGSSNASFPTVTERRDGCIASFIGCCTDTSNDNNDTIMNNHIEPSSNHHRLVVVGGSNGKTKLASSEIINIQTMTIPMSKLNLPNDVKNEIVSFL